MVSSNPHHLWIPRAKAVPKHWYNETAVLKTLVLSSPDFWGPSLKWEYLLNCLYTTRKSTTGWCTLKRLMTLTGSISQNSRPYHHLVMCVVHSLQTGVFGPCCSYMLHLQQQEQEILRKEVQCHLLSYFIIPAGTVRLIGLIEEETSPFRLEQ